MSTGGIVLSTCGLALVNLTVQRESRSCCRSFAGLPLPILRNAAGLDGVLLFLRIALLGRGDQAGIDDLVRHGALYPSARTRL